MVEEDTGKRKTENLIFIRKLIDLAEGFSTPVLAEQVVYSNCHTGHAFRMDEEDIREWLFYPLLLYRALSGFNREALKNGNDPIWINPEELYTYIDNETTIYKYADHQPTEYLTSQEQALEAALMEVLE